MKPGVVSQLPYSHMSVIPVIHLIAAGSSAVEDQLALLQDRIDCLGELTTTIVSTNSIEITDKQRFFVGDHPAQQFEHRTQHGGNFKCCGCSTRFHGGMKYTTFLVHTYTLVAHAPQQLEIVSLRSVNTENQERL